MLAHLHLRDLVIVDETELELGPGLTALTGETGAGKSIVVDALLLIAGGRAGGDSVREGAERAEVAASFTALSDAARNWLEAQAIPHEGEVIARRVIGADGRSRAYVNGQLVALQQLRDLAEFLLDIHGQQEFQHLVKRGAQREMLDEHLETPDLRDAAAEAYQAVRACRGEYEALETAAADRGSRLDLLRYQLAELKAEVTTVSAIEALFIEQKRMAARGRLGALARTALTTIYDADTGNTGAASAHDALAKASTALRTAADTDPELGPPAQLLAEATILTQEAATALSRYLDTLDVDPGRQEEIERHAAALESLARKHRLTVVELPAQLARVELELRTLDQAEQSLAEIERRRERLHDEYRAVAERLTQARLRAAASFSEQVTQLMQTLGMAGGRFAVNVQPNPAEFAAHGVDEIEFQVSANPGQPLKSLARVASGGELSRISLAIQVAAASRASALCMVFDEVDAGIGGAVAEIVGRTLREVGSRAQVLCVTHLAQVAALAHCQFRVVKQSDGKITRTAVNALNPAERVDEIARMLGGIDISDQARAHAREMLTGAARSDSGASPSDAGAAARSPSNKRRAKATPG